MATKSDYLQQKRLNPADDLRRALSRLEEIQPDIKRLNSTQALGVLRDLDHAYDLLQQLEAKDINIQGEWGRFQASEAFLRRWTGPLLRSLGGPGALSDFRPSPPPARDRWWWFIHEAVAAHQQRRVRALVGAGVAVFVGLATLWLLFNTVLAPDPLVVAKVDAENEALLALDMGDYQESLIQIEYGLSQVPDDPDLLLFRGVLQAKLGDVAAASESYARAEAGLGPVMFYVTRTQLWLRLGDAEAAEEDIRAALALDETVPVSWLLLGQALEAQGRTFEAIPAYEQAGQLALDSGESQIVVLARVALGRIGAGP